MIAEFMGGEFERKRDLFDDRYNETFSFIGGQGNVWRAIYTARHHYSIPMLAYHHAWDWIMPVIEKIEEIDKSGSVFSVRIEHGECNIFESSASAPMVLRFSRESSSKLEAVYKAVVAFIIWHNNQPK